MSDAAQATASSLAERRRWEKFAAGDIIRSNPRERESPPSPPPNGGLYAWSGGVRPRYGLVMDTPQDRTHYCYVVLWSSGVAWVEPDYLEAHHFVIERCNG